MKTRPEAPHQEAAPQRSVPTRPMAEASRPGGTVRVSVLEVGHDEEEKEAGYGHGV